MAVLGEDTFSTFLGCIWATAKSIPGDFTIDEDDTDLLEKLYGEYPPEVQVKIIGVLGLAAQGNSVATTRQITAFVLKEETEAAPSVMIEIMDAIMEIFADGDREYDIPLFVEGGLLPHLKMALPRWRKRVRKIDGRKEPDLRDRCDETLANFADFLKYKESEARLK
jgi:hypothetical protein